MSASYSTDNIYFTAMRGRQVGITFKNDDLEQTFKAIPDPTHGSTWPILLLKKWQMEGLCCNKGKKILLPRSFFLLFQCPYWCAHFVYNSSIHKLSL